VECTQGKRKERREVGGLGLFIFVFVLCGWLCWLVGLHILEYREMRERGGQRDMKRRREGGVERER
jgi:hypothetical protein